MAPKYRVNLIVRSESHGDDAVGVSVGYFDNAPAARSAGISLMGLDSDAAADIFDGRYVRHGVYADYDNGEIVGYEVERVGGSSIAYDFQWQMGEPINPVRVQVVGVDPRSGVEMIKSLAVLDGDHDAAGLRDEIIARPEVADNLDRVSDLIRLRDAVDPGHPDPRGVEIGAQSSVARSLSRAADALRAPARIGWPGGVVAEKVRVRIVIG